MCVSEINRVRKDMYSDTVNGLVDRHPLELPEPIGPIIHLQEKLFVPVKEYPDVSSCFIHYIYCKLCLPDIVNLELADKLFFLQK